LVDDVPIAGASASTGRSAAVAVRPATGACSSFRRDHRAAERGLLYSFLGQRSEKMPPVAEELRRKGVTTADRETALATRRVNAERKKTLPAREVLHKIPEDRQVLPEVRPERLQRSRTCSHQVSVR
jgi:hypothetical protein